MPPVTYSGTTAYTASTPVTWTAWNGQYVIAAGTSTTATLYLNPPAWETWNQYYPQASGSPYQETAEQRAAREERQRENVRQAEEQRAQREVQCREAKARAEALLFSLLTDEQAASYREKGFFEVRGSKGGRWRIRSSGQSGNVDLMPEIGEARDESYCGHPPDSLPAADAHLAQMLHLVTDEDSFKRVANIQYRRPARAAA